jgi:hypothetical protein
MTNFFQPVSIRVVDLAKDPCPMGSLTRSTKENQVATGNGNEIHRLIGWAFWTFARLNGCQRGGFASQRGSDDDRRYLNLERWETRNISCFQGFRGSADDLKKFEIAPI